MSLHRRPGWTLPNGHLVRSNAEVALCDYLSEMNFAHTHWEGNFEIPIGTDQLRLFTPSITLTDLKKDGCIIVIQAIDGVTPGSGLRRMQAFCKTYSHDYFLIVIARRPLHHRVPEDAYHRLFPLEDFLPLLQFLRGLQT